MSTAAQPPLPITVLSYNVAYEAMINKTTGTAGSLGIKCVPVAPGSRLTVCAKNMADMIDGLPRGLGISALDLVGIQEASRWQELQQAASQTLQGMLSFDTKVNNTQIVSFYNGNRYTLGQHGGWSFTGSPDRPFQILVLQENQGSGGVIFINIHAPHHYAVNAMQQDLSKALQSLSPQLSAAQKAYPIIALGDFNDTGWDEINNKFALNSWLPFSDAGISTAVALGGQPPLTCCQPDGNWDAGAGKIKKGWRGGDYIFYSQTPANPVIPPNYLSGNLQSDHLPVAAILS